MKEETKTTIVSLENALKQDQGMKEETKKAVQKALDYIYESERQNGIFDRLKSGESMKYVSAKMIAFNAKFYREHRWEQINDPGLNAEIKNMFN